MSVQPCATAATVPDRIAVPLGDRWRVIAYAEITWVEARNMKCQLHTATENLDVHRSLKALTSLLPGDQFLRVNRSALVNADWIVEWRPKSHGDGLVILRGGTEVVVARSRREAVFALLTDRTQRRRGA